MISDCLKCDRKQFVRQGLMVCTVDGRDIIDHDAAQVCPLGKFGKHAALTVDEGLAKRVLHGMIGIAKAVTNTGTAPLPVIAHRRGICKACPHSRQRFGVLQSCELCGCALAAKTKLASEKCPAGKWDATATP